MVNIRRLVRVALEMGMYVIGGNRMAANVSPNRRTIQDTMARSCDDDAAYTYHVYPRLLHDNLRDQDGD